MRVCGVCVDLVADLVLQEGGGAYFNVLWGITLGAWFARMLKSRTLLVPMARGNLGLAA